MYTDLVCKGGGVKGIALVGAITCLEDNGYKFKRIAGTSAGAIIGSLLAVGYSGKEIRDMMFTLDFNKLSDKNKLQYIPFIGSTLSLLFKKGFHSGNCIESFLEEKFQQKNKTTFKDIMDGNDSRLKVIATDVTNHSLLILPDDLYKYNINPYDFKISKAVRMSISVPIYYNPILLNKNNNPSYIVDGGLLSNFPIWIFDTNNIPKWPTFGLNLYDNMHNVNNNNNNRTSFICYLNDIIETSLNTAEDEYYKDKDSIRIINIPTLGVNTLDFNITNEKMIELYDSGYLATKNFINTWSFDNYIKKYRL